VKAGAAAAWLHERIASGVTLYTGCGSTAHLAHALAFAHRQRLHRAAWAEAASELWLAPGSEGPPADMIVAISRSGETSETIHACLRARRAGLRVAAITTNSGGNLIEVADHAVTLDFAAEESVVQTRSFTSMMLAVLAAQCSAAGRDAESAYGGVDELGETMMAAAAPVVERLRDPGFEVVYVLGSGLDYGLACEGALKIKEMSGTFCEAVPILDFRHGPISLVDERSAALVLCGAGLPYELAVAEEITARGAYVATVGPDPRCTIETPAGASAQATAVARLVVCQLTGLKRGISKGLNPDTPSGVPPYILI
jgi:glucosamine--fructose-6-phosphate aminotransferase (isomerizing)